MHEAVLGIVFDSGDTLVRPSAGAWWPGPGFEEAVAERCPGAPLEGPAFDGALDRGMEYLDARLETPVPDEDAEVDHFAGYYDVVLGELGCDAPGLARQLATGLVRGTIVEPFPDTHDALERLSRGLALAVVSNAWPSLERQYEELGLRGFFDAFLLSGPLGMWKPDTRVYTLAAERLGLPPERLVYVDDDPEYVAIARTLGFRGVVMGRDGGGDVTGLGELEALLASEQPG